MSRAPGRQQFLIAAPGCRWARRLKQGGSRGRVQLPLAVNGLRRDFTSAPHLLLPGAAGSQRHIEILISAGSWTMPRDAAKLRSGLWRLQRPVVLRVTHETSCLCRREARRDAQPEFYGRFHARSAFTPRLSMMMALGHFEVGLRS